MYKDSCAFLMEQPKARVRVWLDNFDTIICDCDGVLWLGNNAIEGAAETLERLKMLGKRIFLCTNNSAKTRQQLLEKALSMGFNINLQQIISSAHSTAAYLKARNFQRKAYVIGLDSIGEELHNVGIQHCGIGPDIMPTRLSDYLANALHIDPDVGAVIVGFDAHFSFCKMIKAATYLNDPTCLFIATNADERFPWPGMVLPDTGSIVRNIQACAGGREPVVIGKPNASICERLLKSGIIEPTRTLVMGDCCESDILLGRNCGFQTLLIGSGINKFEDLDKWKYSDEPEHKKLIPDAFLSKLGDLMEFL